MRAVIDMAAGLGVTTLAEGVEDEAVLEQLRQLGCDEAQGYLSAKPMPADLCRAFLASSMNSAVLHPPSPATLRSARRAAQNRSKPNADALTAKRRAAL